MLLLHCTLLEYSLPSVNVNLMKARVKMFEQIVYKLDGHVQEEAVRASAHFYINGHVTSTIFNIGVGKVLALNTKSHFFENYHEDIVAVDSKEYIKRLQEFLTQVA